MIDKGVNELHWHILIRYQTLSSCVTRCSDSSSGPDDEPTAFKLLLVTLKTSLVMKKVRFYGNWDGWWLWLVLNICILHFKVQSCSDLIIWHIKIPVCVTEKDSDIPEAVKFAGLVWSCKIKLHTRKHFLQEVRHVRLQSKAPWMRLLKMGVYSRI